MTIQWTPAQARRHLAKQGQDYDEATSPAPQPRKSKRGMSREQGEGSIEPLNGSHIHTGQSRGRVRVVEWRWGRLGDTSHLWGYRAKANCSGYISKCGRVQRNQEPDGNNDNPCVLCMGEQE